MNEKPIERLNYYNGQRLEAEDFRLEQDYHMRIQRWLMKSLFSPGVADGLEVYPIDAQKPDGSILKNGKLFVTAGLALDAVGRAIILANPATLIPQARFLCVRYAEQKEGLEQSECRMRNGTRAVAQGPQRIVSGAEFTWRTAVPQARSNEIVIAELELNSDCTIARVVAGARDTAVPAQVSRVFSYALEGEKDIAEGTPKTLVFHITGRKPNQLLLSLRGLPISRLFYTELAQHTHGTQDGSLPSHSHSLSGVSTAKDGGHTHEYYVRDTIIKDVIAADGGNVLRPNDAAALSTGTYSPISQTGQAYRYEVLMRRREIEQSGDPANVITYDAPNQTQKKMTDVAAEADNSDVPKHKHFFDATAKTGDVTPAANGGSVSISKPTIGTTGMQLDAEQDPIAPLDSTPPLPAALFHISGLEITYDDIPITNAVLARIKQVDRDYARWQDLLGNGTDTHPFVAEGTPLVRIDDLDLGNGKTIGLTQGAHAITLSVSGARNGGCIHYNLYIE